MDAQDKGTKRRRWDGRPVPVNEWFDDHFSTLLYIETLNVDRDCKPVYERMRAKPGAPKRGVVAGASTIPLGRSEEEKEYPTILVDGVLLYGHDDWDCIDDMLAEGLVTVEGPSMEPAVRLTSKGWKVAHALRRHKAERKHMSEFNIMEHLPATVDDDLIRLAQNESGRDWSEDDLRRIIGKLRTLTGTFYWMCFRADIGTECHPFMEFNGLLSKYVQLCANAAEAGLPFPIASVHTGLPLPMAAHDVEYLAEKFACIFGPYFQAHPKLSKLFYERLMEGK